MYKRQQLIKEQWGAQNSSDALNTKAKGFQPSRASCIGGPGCDSSQTPGLEF